MLEKKVENDVKTTFEIQKDVPRTLRIYFRSEENKLLLFNVLKAYANYD